MRTMLLLSALLWAALAQAQIVYHDASTLPLLGKATQATATRYERLPDSLQAVCRPSLWELGQNSAGLAIRFRSNSTRINARWEVRQNFYMPHMTPVGIKGVDLYCLDEGRWYFAGSGFPDGKQSEATLVRNMTPREREYLLYLPLYDGATGLSIGVDSLASFGEPLVDLPVRSKPLVFYGTSILQGGCANRPGMAHTNILERRMQRECINLGFSGNARLDLEIAHVMAGVDASVFILDFLPNVTAAQVEERAEQFYAIIRRARPDTPILFVENPPFPHARFNTEVAREIQEENKLLASLVKAWQERGDKQVYLFASEGMIGDDGEATVDGNHFTDLGFMRYADRLQPVLETLAGDRSGK